MAKEKKKSFIKKRKELRPDALEYFASPGVVLEFANLSGRLAVSGRDVKEINEILHYASSIPSVADFMGIVKKENKGEEKKPGVS